MKSYGKYAKLFKFQGETISNLWKYNSHVAKENGFEDLAQTWEQLDQIYKEYVKGKEAGKLDNKQKAAGSARVPTLKQSVLAFPVTKNLKVDTKVSILIF